MRHVDLSEDAVEIEVVVARSTPDSADLGDSALQVRFLSIQMPPVLLPQAGVYRLYLICNGSEIGIETIHAR